MLASVFSFVFITLCAKGNLLAAVELLLNLINRLWASLAVELLLNWKNKLCASPILLLLKSDSLNSDCFEEATSNHPSLFLDFC